MSTQTYTVGSNAYNQIPDVCSVFGHSAAVIGGEKALDAVRRKILKACKGSSITITGFYNYGSEASSESIQKLEKIRAVKAADMIFAVGGGRAIDTAKILAQKTGRPYFTFPTIPSTSAAGTNFGILHDSDGSVKESFSTGEKPKHIFIDSDILIRTPEKYFRAGLGSALADFYESKTTLFPSTSNKDSKSSFQIDPQIFNDFKNKRITPQLEQLFVSIFVPHESSSTIHAVSSHSFTNSYALRQTEYFGHLYGEIKSYCMLVLLAAGIYPNEFRQLYSAQNQIGLPTCIRDLHCNREEIPAIIKEIYWDKNTNDLFSKIPSRTLLKSIDFLEHYAEKRKTVFNTSSYRHAFQ